MPSPWVARAQRQAREAGTEARREAEPTLADPVVADRRLPGGAGTDEQPREEFDRELDLWREFATSPREGRPARPA